MQAPPQSGYQIGSDGEDAILVPETQPDEPQPGGLQTPQLPPLQFTDQQAPYFSQQPSVMLSHGLVYQVCCSLPEPSLVCNCRTSSGAAKWMQAMLEVWGDVTGYV